MNTHLTSDAGDGRADLAALSTCIAENSPLPMAMVQGDRQIVGYANLAFCELLDKPKEELIGTQLGEVVPKNDECVTLIERVLRTGMPASHTEEEHSHTHPLFWSYTIWPVMSAQWPEGVMIQVTESAQLREKTRAMNEALVLGSVRLHEIATAADSSNALLLVEVGERKQAEEALRKAQSELKDRAGQLEGLVAERTAELTTTNKQLETFVYSIAHDLRAPLRAMQAFSTMLKEEAGDTLNETAQHYADRINNSAQFMDAMLIDLLAFSRVSQEGMELTSVNLSATVDSVLSRFQDEIREKGARMENAGPWPTVLAHEATLAQVLFNLTSNALKFTKTNVPVVVTLRTEEQSGFTCIWVEDNGIGIALEHQAQVFRPFLRLDGEKYGGTGIGLAIVQKGVERMGGRVGVQSDSGKGSRFWFELRNPPLLL